MKKFGNLFVWLMTWGGIKTGFLADWLHPMVRVFLSFGTILVLLSWATGGFK